MGLAGEKLEQRILMPTVELLERIGVDPLARQPQELRVRLGRHAR